MADPVVIERAVRGLDARTKHVRRQVGTCPMAEMAARWLGAREVAGGAELTALLWSLARDRRWIVQPLFDMVRGDLWVRALGLLGPGERKSPGPLHG